MKSPGGGLLAGGRLAIAVAVLLLIALVYVKHTGDTTYNETLAKHDRAISTARAREETLEEERNELAKKLKLIQASELSLKTNLETARAASVHLETRVKEFETKAASAGANQAELEKQLQDVKSQVTFLSNAEKRASEELQKAQAERSEHALRLGEVSNQLDHLKLVGAIPDMSNRADTPCSEDTSLHSVITMFNSKVASVAPGKKVVFVTGAAGFIGMHTSLQMIADGDLVLGLDNFNAYYDVRLKDERESKLKEVGVTVIHGDVCNYQLVKCLLTQIPFTHVLHLAAQAGVRYALKAPFEYVQANVMCFVSILEAIKEAQKKTNRTLVTVYASSSSVYGLQKKTPFSETDKLDQQASLYGATKKSNENIAHAYNNIHGLKLTGLRFFTVYGPLGRPDMAYFSFTNDILDNKPITVFQNPDGTEPLRDFTYVTDIVKGIIASLDNGADFEIFNLGNNHPEPVSKLIGTLETYIGRKAVRKIAPVSGGDVPATYANATHSNAVLGFKAKVSLADGLKNFISWYSEYYGVALPIKE